MLAPLIFAMLVRFSRSARIPIHKIAMRMQRGVAALLVPSLASMMACSRMSHSQPAVEPKAVPDSGISFIYTVSTNRTDSIGRNHWNSRANVQMLNGEIRLDYLAGEPMLCCALDGVTFSRIRMSYPTNPSGTAAVLILDDGRLVVLDGEGTRWTDVTASNAGTFSAGSRDLNLETFLRAKGGSVTYTDLGVGEPISGFRTRRVRIVQQFMTGVEVMQFKTLDTRTDTSEVWISRDIKVDSESAAAWSRTFGAAGYFSTPRLRAELEPFIRELGCGGIPLRVITHLTRSNGRDSAIHDTVRAEVSNFEKKKIAPRLFRPARNATLLPFTLASGPRGTVHVVHTLDNDEPSADSIVRNYRRPPKLTFKCGGKSKRPKH